MKNRRTRFIALALVVLAAASGLSLFGTGEAGAAPCCSSCEAGYWYCLSQCNGDPTCEYQCDQRWERCFRWCSFSC